MQLLEELLRTSREHGLKEACVVEYLMDEAVKEVAVENMEAQEKIGDGATEEDATVQSAVELGGDLSSISAGDDVGQYETGKKEGNDSNSRHDATVGGTVYARGATKITKDGRDDVVQEYLTCGQTGSHKHPFHLRPLPKQERIVPILLQRFRENSISPKQSSYVDPSDWKIGVVIDGESMMELFFFHMHFRQDGTNSVPRRTSKLCECCCLCAEFEIFSCRKCSRQICGRCTNKMACHLCRGSTRCPFVASPEK